ncbi:Gfo/Idh/MocA family protein [Chelativorans salis]|uniref:Gfo/Idh/MocA family oxidoreductase n=1 Tax=Chelativorans salis TaxID=2978478 RepID=A0ABT2LQZ3_9HYPH|nr:Gfo/Idh/MocA family oxidoreductase [Chelativorans sp. EGI FJ00035]MCT7376970.1 Gfo/Idh/MocA family oxidoreductase [Chelativorans sp. EGI FJ00035]
MTLNIGWIGCGRHASQMLLPQLVREDVRIAAVCDVNSVRTAEVARQYGVRDIFSNAHDLLVHPGLDAIGLAIGPAAHLEIGMAALGRGLPVFMEKPPGASHEDALRLQDMSQKAGKPLVVGFMKRFSVGNKIAKRVIERDFGSPLGFYGSYMTAPTYFEGNADYTGFLLHHCVHYMDLPAHLVGPIAAMEPRVIEREPGKILLHIAIEFDNGAIGTLVMGTIQSRGTPMEFVQVMGDHRRIEIDNIVRVSYHRDPPFKSDNPEASLFDGEDTLTWRPNFTAAANEDFKGYHELLTKTVAAFRGERSAVPLIEDGVTAMRWLETVRAGLPA